MKGFLWGVGRGWTGFVLKTWSGQVEGLVKLTYGSYCTPKYCYDWLFAAQPALDTDERNSGGNDERGKINDDNDNKMKNDETEEAAGGKRTALLGRQTNEEEEEDSTDHDILAQQVIV